MTIAFFFQRVMAEHSSDKDYQKHLQSKEEEWEALCLRCGACCGVFDDPCKHLIKDAKGIYSCEVYEHRCDMQETVSGKKFYCLPIRNILHIGWDHDYLCSYKKSMRTHE